MCVIPLNASNFDCLDAEFSWEGMGQWEKNWRAGCKRWVEGSFVSIIQVTFCLFILSVYGCLVKGRQVEDKEKCGLNSLGIVLECEIGAMFRRRRFRSNFSVSVRFSIVLNDNVTKVVGVQ